MADHNMSCANIDAAEDALAQARSLDPDCAEIFFVQAKMLRAAGDAQAAVRAFQQAIERAPAVSHYHLELGIHYRYFLPDSAKNEAEAAECFRRAIELDANNGPAHDQLSRLLSLSSVEHLRDARGAVCHANQAVANGRRLRGEDSYSQATLGMALYRAERFEEAMQAFTRCKTLEGSAMLPVDVLIAMCLYRLGDVEKAQDSWQESQAAADHSDPVVRLVIQEARELFENAAH